MPAETHDKRTVRYFVSYAHDDSDLAAKLLAQLKRQFGASKNYSFELWQDAKILPGEKWHEEIQNAIDQCDFGLLLVSPAFLGSAYVGKHELPQFIDGERMCMPVLLRAIDFANHDTKGLEDLQIFRFKSEHAEAPKTFEDCTSDLLQSNFGFALFGQIKGRLDKENAGRGITATPRKLETSIPHNLPTLQPFFGREDELKKIADALDPNSRTWGALIDGPAAWARPPSLSARPTTLRLTISRRSSSSRSRSANSMTTEFAT